MAKAYTNRSNANRAIKNIVDAGYRTFFQTTTVLGDKDVGFTAAIELKRAAGQEIFDMLVQKGFAVVWHENNACNEPPKAVTTAAQDNQIDPLENNMDNQAEEAVAVDVVAQAQATVDAAKARVATAVAAEKKARAMAKDHATNLKKSQAYNKSLSAEDDNKAQAVENEAGWQTAADASKKAAEDAKAEVAAAKDAQKAAAEALKEAKASTKAEAKAKPERIEQNGMKRPIDGGPSHRIWDAADAKAEELGRAPALADIFKPLVDSGIKEATVKAAYAHWRKFHGITGRVLSEADAAKAEAAAAEKQRKQEEREAAKAQREADKAAKEQAKAEAAQAKAAEAAAKAEAAKAAAPEAAPTE